MITKCGESKPNPVHRFKIPIISSAGHALKHTMLNKVYVLSELILHMKTFLELTKVQHSKQIEKLGNMSRGDAYLFGVFWYKCGVEKDSQLVLLRVVSGSFGVPQTHGNPEHDSFAPYSRLGDQKT